MDRSRRLKLAGATAPVQFIMSVALALLLARLYRDDSGEWSDLIGVVVGMVLGPCVGAMLMTVLVQRARSVSAAKALLAGGTAGIVTFVAILILFGTGIHPVTALLVVVAVTVVAMWVLSGRG